MDTLALVLLGAIWGSSFLFMKIGAPIVGPISLVQWRMVFAVVAMLPIFWVKRQRMQRTDYNHLLVLAITNSVLPFTLLSYASMHLSSAHASLLNGTAPFFSALLGGIFFGEKLSSRQISGLVLGFFGVWVLFSDHVAVTPAGVLPILAGLGAGFCYGFVGNYSKGYLGHITPFLVTFWYCLLGALLMIPLSYGGPQLWDFDRRVAGSAAALGILSTALGFFIYFQLLKKVGATRSLTVTFLIPVFACLWGWIFLDEPVTMKMVLGAAVVFWGIQRMNAKSIPSLSVPKA